MRALFLSLLVMSSTASAASVRIRELTDVAGVRDNELFGYGLVVGLTGTGDTERVFFTSQSISGMLGRLGIRVDPAMVRSRNVAAVMVTARMPTFSRAGAHLDVTVSAMGNARSLQGGTLLFTPLQGADGEVHAVAQGQVQVGGFTAMSAGSSLQRNSPASGRVPGGGTVERPVLVDFGTGPVTLSLKNPDFTTASRIAKAVDTSLGEGSARAVDPAAVEVAVPPAFKDNIVGLLAQLEQLEVDASGRARVVLSERTGTVVAGEEVRLRPAAVSHGGLQIAIQQRPVVSQPGPFARTGNTVNQPVSELSAREEGRGVAALPAASTVQDLAKALNALGATPRDLVSILQALKAAGALDADVEVM